MRLIHTFQDSESAQVFSLFLSLEKIENKLEVLKTEPKKYEIWGVREEDLSLAEQHLNAYLLNPNADCFEKVRKTAASVNQAFSEVLNLAKEQKVAKKYSFRQRHSSSSHSLLTTFFITLCVLLFAVKAFEFPMENSITASLLFDFDTSSHAWPGIYPYLIAGIKNGFLPLFDWFSYFNIFHKIREGEFWRLFTPALLHGGFLHIGFNMLWLNTIGRQIESKISAPKYLIFILASGIFSNTAQYLVSGMFFLGFSGVIFAMLGFIYMRQKTALWEGYLLHPNAFSFILAFTGVLFTLELISFFMLIAGQPPLSIGFANTAHISGLFFGLLLGRCDFFASKQ